MRSFTRELRVHPRPEPGLFLAPLQPLGLQDLAHPAALHADALLAQVGHQAVQGPRREWQPQLGGPRQRRSDNGAALLGGVGRRAPRAHVLLQPRKAALVEARLSQKRTVAPHSPILAAIPGALSPSTACWMICARRTSPAPSFCERVIPASLCASSLNPRTRSVIATSPAWTAAPCNAPDPEKSYPTCRMHHLARLWPFSIFWC